MLSDKEKVLKICPDATCVKHGNVWLITSIENGKISWLGMSHTDENVAWHYAIAIINHKIMQKLSS